MAHRGLSDAEFFTKLAKWNRGYPFFRQREERWFAAFTAGTRRVNEERQSQALVSARRLARKMATAEAIEGKTHTQIASEFGMGLNNYRNWRNRYKEILAEELAYADALMEQERRQAVRRSMQRLTVDIDRAHDNVSGILGKESEAPPAVKLRAAFGVIDRVSPPVKRVENLNANVQLSAKTIRLIQATVIGPEDEGEEGNGDEAEVEAEMLRAENG